jgi:hypothetical protein
MKRVLLLIAVLVAIIWFFRSTCEIENDTDYPLKNIILSGTSFSKTILEIPSANKHKISFFPPSNSDLMIAFTANNKKFEKQVAPYYEGGAVNIKVRNDFTIESKVNILGH